MKNVTNNRPLSPHLTIYKPQITSVSSIVGRLCGIYSFAFIMYSLWVFIIDASVDISVTSIFPFAINSKFIFLKITSLLFTTGFVFCFSLYCLTFLRHILWDFGYCLSLKTSNILGFICLSVPFGVTVGFLVFIFSII